MYVANTLCCQRVLMMRPSLGNHAPLHCTVCVEVHIYSKCVTNVLLKNMASHVMLS